MDVPLWVDLLYVSSTAAVQGVWNVTYAQEQALCSIVDSR